MSNYDKIYKHDGQDYEFNYSDVEKLTLLPINKTNIFTGERIRIDFSFAYNESLGIVVLRGQYNDIIGSAVGIDKDEMADTIFQSLVDRTPIDNMATIASAKEDIVKLFSKNYITRNILLEDFEDTCNAVIKFENDSIGEAYKVKIQSSNSGRINVVLEDAFLADANIKGVYDVTVKLSNATISFNTDDYTVQAGLIDTISFLLNHNDLTIEENAVPLKEVKVTIEKAEEIRKQVNSSLSIFQEDDYEEDFLDLDFD